MVKVGVIQAGTVMLNTPATLTKLQALTKEIVAQGAEIVLFPEAFVGGYINGLQFDLNEISVSDDAREEFVRYHNSAITFEGPESQQIADTAQEHNVYLVVPVIEKDGGTLYCSVFFYGPDGTKLGRHRKLKPTRCERVVWGHGDGSMLPVFDTPLGRIGSAICWENYMPPLRTYYYSKGIELYFAPCADDADTWFTSMRHIAVEGRCFVISTCQYLTAKDFPENHPTRTNEQDKVLLRGGACVIDPLGKVLLQPDYSGEKLVVVECNLNDVRRSKFDMDCVGHYSRPDIFTVLVNEKPQRAVKFIQDGTAKLTL